MADNEEEEKQFRKLIEQNAIPSKKKYFIMFSVVIIGAVFTMFIIGLSTMTKVVNIRKEIDLEDPSSLNLYLSLYEAVPSI